ncbi:MAG: nucleotide sugar dehydrogenase [Bacteroidetes bacterium]|nr:MAG: nucleotide sugar dehydrogenase [Bacteroidota bacterium]
MLDSLKNKKTSLAVIGLGYVGLPVALSFAKKIKVVGFDINASRIASLQKNIDPSGELPAADFEDADILFSSNSKDLAQVSFFIIAVPTPIDEYNQPDLSPLLKATQTVAKVLKKGDYVVFESTVYPGCTEEKCVPILEQETGLVFNKDFKIGYSPERINPGDKEHTLKNVIKVVSGSDAESLAAVASVYEMVVEVGVHRASSIKVAEASKVIENTQRDLNIALMNELSMIFDKLNISTYEVLEAAGTKWNFLKFFPGLVGGHCIGVDPYYLTFKAAHMGHFPKVILSGREINDGMGAYIAKKTLQLMISQKIDILNSRILVLGATFKENVSDIRNSKVVDMVRELQSFNLQVEITDPHASKDEFLHEYKQNLVEKPTGKYDAVILAVAHKEYKNKTEQYFTDLTKNTGILIDLKGVYQNQIKNLVYWSL